MSFWNKRLTTSNDATKCKQVEEDLRLSKENYSKEFQSSPNLVFISTLAEGQFVEVNNSFLNLLGYERKEVISQTSCTLNIWADLDEHTSVVQRLQVGESVYNQKVCLRTKSGEIKTLLGFVELINLYAKPCLLFVANDITDCKQIEEALRHSEMKYRTIFENSQAAIGRICLQDGLFLDANQRCAEIMGYHSAVDLIGKQYATNFCANPRDHKEVLAILLQHGEVHNFELPVRLADGLIKWISLWLRLNAEEDCLNFVFTDISDCKRAKEALHCAETRLWQQQNVLLELPKNKAFYSGDVNAALQIVTQTAARVLDIEFVSIWFYDASHAKICLQCLYQLSTQQHNLERVEFYAERYPAYFQAMETDKVINAPYARTDPRTQEFVTDRLISMNITSMMDVPIRSGGQTIGVICHEHIGSPRRWTLEEQNFASYLAYLISLAMEAHDRRLAEAALRESETRFRAMFNQAAVGIALVSLDGEFIEVNPAMCDITGYNRDELSLMNFQDVTHPDDLDGSWTNVQRILASEIQNHSIERRYIRKDGSTTWVNLLTSSIEWDRAGQQKYAVGIIQDISERKRAEQALALRAERDSLISSISRQLLNQEMDTAINFTLKVVAEFTGSDRSYVFQFLSNQIRLDKTYERCAVGIQPFIYESEECLVKAHPWCCQKLLNGEVLNVPSVSELPPAVAIDKAEWQHRSIQSLLIVPMVHSSEVVGCIGLDVVSSLKTWYEDDISLLRLVGEMIAIGLARHEAEQALRVAYDTLESTLQQLKATQAQIIAQEKLASLGALTAGIAHEIKNPLNFVNNFAQLSVELTQELVEEIENQQDRLNPETKEYIEEILNDLSQNAQKISEHGKRADNIVHGMLMLSRGQLGKRQLTDINALLAEAVNLAYHGIRTKELSFKIVIETDYDDNLGKLNVVPQNISRAFINIINNACYAVYEKKKEVGEGFSPTLLVSTINLGKQVEIRIRDNGKGIPKSVLDKIFNPFFTTKPTGEGTGLGLSISHDIIVEEHQGEIKVETEPGNYTAFIITLPKTVFNKSDIHGWK